MVKLLNVLICKRNPFLEIESVLVFYECLWVSCYGVNGQSPITRMYPFMIGVKSGFL